jgi:hypothetical protein
MVDAAERGGGGGGGWWHAHTHARTHALTRSNAHARMQRTSRTQLKHSKGVSKKELIEVMTIVDDDNRCTHITAHHNGLDLHI